MLNGIVEMKLFDHLSARIYKMCLQILYLEYTYKQCLALNNLIAPRSTLSIGQIELFGI